MDRGSRCSPRPLSGGVRPTSGGLCALRVGALVLVLFVSAPESFVPRTVADAQAQQQPAGKVYRIGLLSQGQPPKAWIEALQQGLRERGYGEGRNLVWYFQSTD